MRVAIAVGVTVLVVLAGAVAVLSVERPRLAGTNNVFDLFPNVPVPPGGEACARDEIVPGDTAAVRVHLTPDASPGGPVELRVMRGSRELARGELAAGWQEGKVDVPVRPVIDRTQAGVTLCFANRDDGDLALWGYGAAADGPRAVVDGQVLNERTRLTYVRPGEESGWEIAPVVARRMAIGRGDLLEGWPFYGWLAATAGTLAATGAAVLRRRRT